MSRYVVYPGCTSIKMKSDGRVFPVDRQGNCEIPDRYAKEMARSAHNKYDYVSPGVSIPDMHNGSGKHCTNPKCGFYAFSFSKTCPKCNGTEFKGD